MTVNVHICLSTKMTNVFTVTEWQRESQLPSAKPPQDHFQVARETERAVHILVSHGQLSSCLMECGNTGGADWSSNTSERPPLGLWRGCPLIEAWMVNPLTPSLPRVTIFHGEHPNPKILAFVPERRERVTHTLIRATIFEVPIIRHTWATSCPLS